MKLISMFLLGSLLSAGPRARDLGVDFEGQTGKYNAITDVPGVTVGHHTLIAGAEPHIIRTGVTAVLPAGKSKSKVPAAVFSFNGNGDMTGNQWIQESGFLEGPIVLTNTYSVGLARDAVRKWGEIHFPNNDPEADDAFMLPVVAETYDGYLNDIKGHHLKEEHVFAALDSASGGAVSEGSVGGGTGMICFQFKCGIGTASRQVILSGNASKNDFNLGVLVQANFGERLELTMRGRPVGQWINDYENGHELLAETSEFKKRKDGSIIIIVATDAPLLPSQLQRLARRASLGLARTGSIAHNSSGDLFLAFSSRSPEVTPEGQEIWNAIPNEKMDPLFRATVEATEEAILNALVAGRTMQGAGNLTVPGIPHYLLQLFFAATN